uniref:Uncharacterized protein n=1 Tax=Pyrodinium bahamense TaxID=73915 RepID=A0A7S0FX24_9DINO|mmetsp:Transcript_52489/g.145557  ORF Transcript_52489/g.145557 Transcript_52489/m.145557 type:complete len:694 (+) Transcript_52489:43-2124(+)
MKLRYALLVAWLHGAALQWSAARLVINKAQPQARNYPVSKVVTLLRDMQKQLEKETDADEEVYEKMKCWCETNDREKSQAIQDAEARINDLRTVIETSTANSARLKQELASHEDDLRKSQDSLDSATALREKQLADFNAEEKDMLQSIQALDAAIVVISRHHAGVVLLDDGALSSALDTAGAQIQMHLSLLSGTITPHQRRLILSLRQAPTFRQAYQPQSGEIFGILKEMKATFEANLAETQQEEASNRKAYTDLRAAKEEEIRATQAALEQKQTQLAEADGKKAHAKQDLEDTQKSFSADDTFLMNLKDKCAATEQEYASRKKMRDDEISAVTQAISILSSDEAHDMFSRTFNPSLFVQRTQVASLARGGSKHAAARKLQGSALALLSAAAAKSRDPRLAALALSAKADPLAEVKAAIDKLIAELEAERKEEAEKRDECTQRSHQNELETERFKRDTSDLRSHADGLKVQISDLEDAVRILTKDVKELQLQLKRRGEDRELENRVFQSALADQRETQELLQKALAVLKAVYAKREVPAAAGLPFVQTSAAQEPPPPGFEAYGQNRAAGGVVGLLEQIIRDAQSMEKEIIRDEQASQEQYESFVKNTNADILSKQQGISHKNGDKSTATQDLIQTETDIRDKTKQLEILTNEGKAIGLDCAFLVENFYVRQEARQQEVNALEEAKAILLSISL